MKANEAKNMYIPQKIYLPYKDGKVIGIVKETGVPFKSGVDGNIEYTRTDAFIKKACDAYCKVCGHYAHSVPTHICRHDCRYFNDFKKYMKGE